MQNYPQDRSTSSHYDTESLLACGSFHPNGTVREGRSQRIAIWNDAKKEDKPIDSTNESQLWTEGLDLTHKGASRLSDSGSSGSEFPARLILPRLSPTGPDTPQAGSG
jgi:hypothetical protein